MEAKRENPICLFVTPPQFMPNLELWGNSARELECIEEIGIVLLSRSRILGFQLANLWWFDLGAAGRLEVGNYFLASAFKLPLFSAKLPLNSSKVLNFRAVTLIPP